jgi:predicted  nucleic acid-binding Zn-ribbon protein
MLDGRSFEKRVFARFDALDARLQKLEVQSELRAVETKPIWERALQEIMETRTEVVKVEDRLGRIENEIKDMRRMFRSTFADVARVQEDLEERIDKIEGRERTP